MKFVRALSHSLLRVAIHTPSRRRERPLQRVRPRPLERKLLNRQCFVDCGYDTGDGSDGSSERSDMDVDSSTHSETDAASLARKFYRLRRVVKILESRVSNLERQLEVGGHHTLGHGVGSVGKLRRHPPTRYQRGHDETPPFTPLVTSTEPAPVNSGSGPDHVPAPPQVSQNPFEHFPSGGSVIIESVEESVGLLGLLGDVTMRNWKLTALCLSVEYLCLYGFVKYRRSSAFTRPVSSTPFGVSQAVGSVVRSTMLAASVLLSRYWT